MLSLIESYEPEATVVVVGRTLPATCLAEDAEGIRWFIQESLEVVHPHTWLRAASSGAAALLVPDGDAYLAMTIESFMERRREDSRLGYLIDPGEWVVFSDLPDYGSLVDAADKVVSLCSGFPGRTVEPEPEETPESVGFVHLHTHSEYSLLDGISMASEIAQVVKEQGGKYFGICDHGNCAGHPDAQREADKHGLKPVFAMEAYLVNDRLKRLEHFPIEEPPKSDVEASAAYKIVREEYVADLRDYWHLVLIATDEEGLHNLWAMSTEASRDGLYGKNARLDWDTLAKYSKGVIATTACLRGPLSHRGLMDGDEEAAVARLGRLMSIFGDRLYVEIHANQLEEQKKVNEGLVRLARRYDLPLVAAVDAHYAVAEDKEPHRVWLSMQTNKDIGDDSTLFAGNQDYHLMPEADVRSALAYLGQDVVDESIRNTAVIALQATATVRGTPTPPVYSKGGVQEDNDRLLDLCLKNWYKTQGKAKSQAEYVARFEHEYPMLVRKGFCGYFLMTAAMTNYARDRHWMVGPGRGSGGGSLVAYLAGITDIDPVDGEIIFERFMTEGRTSLPDFDIDYPASHKQDMQKMARDTWGEDSVTVVGSVLRLKSKGVIDKLGKALSSTLPEDFYRDQQMIGYIIKDAEADSAGLGVPWEDLWVKEADRLQPYRDRYPYLFEMADKLVGRVFAFGQHAAGLVISTDGALTTRLPLRRATEDGHMIAQFDKDVLEDLGFVKFDLLTLRNLDTIQDAIDLVRDRRGHEVNVYNWRDEYEDPQVWEEVANAYTLGIFQIETALGTQFAKKMYPRNLSDLADLVTVVRPGPRNSGLTDTYIRRRNGEEPVSYPDPRLEKVLAKTYGCMLYQEDIMQACIILGGYTDDEADGVRKILGKKKVELVAAAGQEFVERVVERGMEREAAMVLWAQMAEFAKYSFNRAHAYAYAVLGYWCAWLKFHYPVEFLTAALSSVDKDRIPSFIKESRRMGFSVLPPDINESGSGFRAGVNSVRYGLDSVKGVGEAAKHIQVAQPFTSFEDFMGRVVEPKGAKVNKGHVAILAKVGAFDTLVPNRRGLETVLLAEKTGDASRCVNKTDGSPSFVWTSITTREGVESEERFTLPCTFDWENEPPPINPRTQKKMKAKAPPKKCTKACRNYTAPPPMKVEDVTPYTDVDIREIESDLLGVFLSSTPFDLLPDEEREVTRGQAELATADRAPEGIYLFAGVLTSRKPYTDKNQRKMGFLEFETEVNTLDVTCFNETWTKYGDTLKTGVLYIFEAEVNRRGLTLYSIAPVLTKEN